MGFLNNKRKTIDELEEQSERLEIQAKIQEQKTDIAEKKALMQQMDEKFGKGKWKKMFRIKVNNSPVVTRTDVVGMSKMRQYLGI